MNQMHFLALLCFGLFCCSAPADPCKGIDGACFTVLVEGVAALDQLEIDVRGDQHQLVSWRAPGPVLLPAPVPVAVSISLARPFELRAVALLGGATVGLGSAALSGRDLEGGAQPRLALKAVSGPSCSDGYRDGTEVDIDCGGGTCGRCRAGAGCAAARDCDSGSCKGGTCAPAACDDGLKNGAESDQDCGGACGACPAGRSCGKDGDCQTGLCRAARCVPASCTDGARNNDETDADCGGATCPVCAEDKGCGADRDCSTGSCQAGRCTIVVSLTSVSPGRGLGGGGTLVTLKGRGFRDGAQVLFGAFAASDVKVLGDDTLSAVTPAAPGAFGPVDVMVKDRNGPQALRRGAFRYHVDTATFGASQGRAGISGPYDLSLGDLNKDGRPDLIIARPTTTIGVLLGNGDGSFKDPALVGLGTDAYYAFAADVNGDGVQDLVSGNYGGNNLGVAIGDGAGGFAAPAFRAINKPFPHHVGDFDGDGKIDLVGIDYINSRAMLFAGNGDGSFKDAAVSQPVDANPYYLAVADYDGDNKLDIALTAQGANTVQVLLGGGDGTLKAPARYGNGGGGAPWGIRAVDLTGDGRPDLVVANTGTEKLSVLRNNGDGTFAAAAYVDLGTRARYVDSADVNGDGLNDVIAAGTGATTLYVLQGRGDGTLLPARELPLSCAPIGLAAADLNGDGRPDLAAACNNEVRIVLNNSNL